MSSSTSADDGMEMPARAAVVAHVAWTVRERFCVTGDSQQPSLCVWQKNV
jgi:hypothetical protein